MTYRLVAVSGFPFLLQNKKLWPSAGSNAARYVEMYCSSTGYLLSCVLLLRFVLEEAHRETL